MIPPSPAAVGYIWQRLTQSCMDQTLRQYLELYAPVRSALMHRPKQGETADYLAFHKAAEAKARLLQEKYGVNI